MTNLNVVKFSFAFCGGLLLAACGDDVTKVTEVTQETSGLEVVATADSLGKCSEDRSGEMKFAQKENAVYVCTDSAWKNVSAVGKASCAAELLADSSGFKIVCGGDSVGVVFSGKNGSDGENGEAGVDGKSCTVEELPLLDSDLGRGVYLVVCGGDTVGTIRDGLAGEGCTVTDSGDGILTQVCGSDTVNLYKGFCGGKPFDPDSSFCYKDSVVALCGGKSYDLSERFCSGDSLHAFCDGKSYNPKDSVCHEEKLYGFFKDARDGQTYRIVTIGSQTWMAENLNYAYMPDTLSFCFNNSADSCAKYGRLYTWAAAMDSIARFTKNGEGCGFDTTCSSAGIVRGVCPVGWHLPDTTEWRILNDSVTVKIGSADSVGYALKSTSGWKLHNGKAGGSDAFGFGVLPAGYRHRYGAFGDVLSFTYFWFSTEYGPNHGYYWFLCYYEYENGYTNHGSKTAAYSVRCVKD